MWPITDQESENRIARAYKRTKGRINGIGELCSQSWEECLTCRWGHFEGVGCLCVCTSPRSYFFLEFSLSELVAKDAIERIEGGQRWFRITFEWKSGGFRGFIAAPEPGEGPSPGPCLGKPYEHVLPLSVSEVNIRRELKRAQGKTKRASVFDRNGDRGRYIWRHWEILSPLNTISTGSLEVFPVLWHPPVPALDFCFLAVT